MGWSVAAERQGRSRRTGLTRLTLSPWSVTAYDEATRQMPVTEQERPDISSRKEDIVSNEDGSIDVLRMLCTVAVE